MIRRPGQDVRIWSIQDRSGNSPATRPYIVRWVVDGRSHSLSFRTKDLADRPIESSGRPCDALNTCLPIPFWLGRGDRYGLSPGRCRQCG